MTRAPSANRVREYADALGVPVLSLTDGRALADLGDEECLALLPRWYCRELVATPAARDRLQAWAAAGARKPTPDDLVRRLRFVGDPEVRPVVLNALDERVPPPVAAYALDDVTFEAVGYSAHGYMIRVAPISGTIVLLSGATRDALAILDVLLHELAHAALLAAPSTPISAADLCNETDAMLLRACKRPDLMRDLLRDQTKVEEAADSLARRWGGRLTCTAEIDNAHTVRRARELDKVFGRGR